MMREIRFRGKRLVGDRLKGEWVYGSLILKRDDDLRPDASILCRIEGYNMEFPVEPSSVSQYLGMKDREGVDIYDGDILHHNGKRAVVEYSSRDAAFKALTTKVQGTHWDLVHRHSRVIGNIFDNDSGLLDDF